MDGEGEIVLVGTAHVSEESVEDVRRAVEEEQPDIVAVELDERRYKSIKGETPDEIEPRDLLQGSKPVEFLIYWLLSYLQAKLGDRFGIEPGADMKAAIEEAETRGLPVALVDRDIHVTVQRFWARLSTLEKLRLLVGISTEMLDRYTYVTTLTTVALVISIPVELFIGPVFLTDLTIPIGFGFGVTGLLIGVLDALLVTAVITLALALFSLLLLLLVNTEAEGIEGMEGVEDFEIEQLTDTDVVSAMMEQFREFSPRGAETLIDERDAYIASNLIDLRANGAKVVAVVGAGHIGGVRNYLDNPGSLPSIEEIEHESKGRRFSLFKAVGYLISAFVVFLFFLLFMAGASDEFLGRLFLYWFLVNGVLTFIGALIAGGHVTSAFAGGLVAWMTSINPLLAAGWVTGYVEVRYLKVSVTDIDDINEIITDTEDTLKNLLSRMYEVPLFRLITVVAVTNAANFIATWLFILFVLPVIGADVNMEALLWRGINNSWDSIIDTATSLLT